MEALVGNTIARMRPQCTARLQVQGLHLGAKSEE
jgi:hypothetical protein